MVSFLFGADDNGVWYHKLYFTNNACLFLFAATSIRSFHRPAEALEPESKASKNKRWMQFIAGLLIEVVIVGYDIYSINECDWSTYSKYPQEDRYYYHNSPASDVRTFKIAAMVLSLGEEVLSSLYLSCKYNSPLDLKSVHTLPVELKASPRFAYFVEALPNLVFGIISSMVAQVCLYLSKYHGCKGPRSQSLNNFLFVSFLFFFGAGFGYCIQFFFVNVKFCCVALWESMQNCWDGCCKIQNSRLRAERFERTKAHHVRLATMFLTLAVGLTRRHGHWGTSHHSKRHHRSGYLPGCNANAVGWITGGVCGRDHEFYIWIITRRMHTAAGV